MKKLNTIHTCHHLLGVALLSCLFGAFIFTGFDAFAGVCAAFKGQWNQFTESLSMLQPHRTVFPN